MKKRNKRIKINDTVILRGQIEAEVSAIISRGKGYREYECAYLNKDGEPVSAWFSIHNIIRKPENNFGFGRKND